jgi:Chaperone of endosialidase
MNPLIRFKTIALSLLVPLVLVCFVFSPTTQAVDPPPDGFYPGRNTAEGQDALLSLGAPGFFVAIDNTAVGFHALYSTTTGAFNTAAGSDALSHNMTGSFNTAVGFNALESNTIGLDNTASGSAALQNNITGNDNTASGSAALLDNTTGSENTAVGLGALESNTSGINNTAVGSVALSSNVTGDNNTASGFQALYSNIEGIDNTANGLNALFGNTTGNDNTASGHSALQSNTTGHDNTANGHDALVNNTTGSDNIAVGHGAGQQLTTGDNNIDIGNAGLAGEANTIRIGHPGFFVEPGVVVGGHTKTFIAGISGAAIGGGAAVRINANGQLGTAPSSQRFKDEIKPMDKASEAILALKPVSFHYKRAVDPEGTPQFGLVAEEVEKVNADLVIRDSDGRPYTVRYDAVNAMLLNEFLKEHRVVKEQQKEIDALKAELKEQRALIQKVNDKVELKKPAPRTVLNQ